MKLHLNLALAVIAGLKEILIEKKQADITVGNVIQTNKTWGARDRNFIADNIYRIVRYKRLFEFCINQEVSDEPSLWKIFGVKLLLENPSLPDWKEFESIKKKEILARNEEAAKLRAIRESIPDWLDELGEKELHENWEREIHALNTSSKLCIRVNTLKTNKGIIQKLFTADGTVFFENELAPDALVLKERKNFRHHPAYKNGLFEVQDVSSQLVVPMLDARPGMKVIDGCAGAGGKTLHLAAWMKNEGEILAVDINENKLQQLKIRSERAGCKIIRPVLAAKLAHSRTLLNKLADRVLLDAPCSGLGVLRRKPDAKWSLTPSFMDELTETQSLILDKYSGMLKTDGILVYSTCSILRSENEEQIKKFLERNKRFQLVQEKRISPAAFGFDGFYIAKLKKTLG